MKGSESSTVAAVVEQCWWVHELVRGGGDRGECAPAVCLVGKEVNGISDMQWNHQGACSRQVHAQMSYPPNRPTTTCPPTHPPVSLEKRLSSRPAGVAPKKAAGRWSTACSRRRWVAAAATMPPLAKEKALTCAEGGVVAGVGLRGGWGWGGGGIGPASEGHG